MHREAYDAVGSMLEQAGIGPDFSGTALDFGGQDVNSTGQGINPREFLSGAVWTGIDIVEAPGVDILLDLTELDAWNWLPIADVVLCTEVLEHVKAWKNVVHNAARCLRGEGLQTAVFTCASTGRPPHGAHGEPSPPEGQWYGNVSPEDLNRVFASMFKEVSLAYNPVPGDAYVWARGVK